MPWSPPPWMAVEGEEGKEGERVVIGLPRSLSPSSSPPPHYRLAGEHLTQKPVCVKLDPLWSILASVQVPWK